MDRPASSSEVLLVEDGSDEDPKPPTFLEETVLPDFSPPAFTQSRDPSSGTLTEDDNEDEIPGAEPSNPSSSASDYPDTTGALVLSRAIVLKDLDDVLHYLQTLNMVTEAMAISQSQKWSEKEEAVRKEASRLDCLYRELQSTTRNIAIIRRQLKAVKKDRKSVQTMLDALQKQEEAAMEAEVRKYEESLLIQYRKSLFSGESKVAELEALITTVSQKRRALDLLEELINRALTLPPSDPNVAQIKALAKRSSRIPTGPRTEVLRSHARARRRETGSSTSRINNRSTSPVETTSRAPENQAFRSLFGDLFAQLGSEENDIIPLSYFETSV